MFKILKIFFLLLGLLSYGSLIAQDLSYKTIDNIPYRQSSDPYITERCVLDIYFPEDTTGCPTVIWFHGGGLIQGNKSIPYKLKKSGLIVVAVNYRLSPKVHVSDCIDDAAAAVSWVFKNIENYGGDPKEIFISGHSAGGYLTNMVGLDKNWLRKYDVDADSIAGLIPFSGHAISHFTYRKEIGIGATQPIIDEFAPLYYVRRDAPPLIIITGDRNLELFGRYEEDAYLYRMMKVVGHKQTYLYEMQGHDHGAMADPAFHILKDHVKEIVDEKKK